MPAALWEWRRKRGFGSGRNLRRVVSAEGWWDVLWWRAVCWAVQEAARSSGEV